MRVVPIVTILIAMILVSGCGNGNGKTEFIASGTIEATMITVSSRVAGDITTLSVDEGSPVANGETLLTIDTRDLDLQRDQVRAQVAQADAQLRLAEQGARIEDRLQAQKAMQAAEASLLQARADFQRINELRAKGSVPQKQLDDVTSMVDIRQAQYDASQENYRKLERGLRPAEIDSVRSAKAQAEAGLQLIEKRISDCSVTAPIEGSVTEKLVEVGEYVTPGRDLIRMADLSTVWLRVYVHEPRLPLIKIGEQVKVRIDGSPKLFTGTITFISDVAEFTPKTIQTEEERVKLVYAVKIELENTDRVLKAGMPADAVFPLQP